MARLLADSLGEAFDVDGRMFRTLRLLFGRPGALTREYLDGRRQRYTPPLRLYLVVSLLFFVAMSWAAGRGLLLEEGETLGTDAPEQARLLADELPRLMFLLLPAFAVLLKAAFPRRLYFDHLIYSLHFHSAAFVALAVMVPLDAMANRHWLPLLLQLVAFGYLIYYFLASLRRVYEAGWGRIVAAGVGIFVVYLTLLTLAIELRRAGGL
jgi:hypothetical protein